jgi:hypothetical protein
MHGPQPEQFLPDDLDFSLTALDWAWRLHNRYYSTDSGQCQAQKEAIR